MSAGKSKREVIRQKRKEKKRRRMMTFIVIALAAAATFSAAVILPKFIGTTPKSDRTKQDSRNGFSIGDPDAPVTVVEFSSYLCSHCKSFSENDEKDFIAEYVHTGDVYFTYVNIPSNSDQSLLASEASYCAAEQNLFFEYKDQLYTYAGNPDAYSQDNLIKYASSAGLDTEAFQDCLASDVYAEAYLQDYQFAASVGLRGTPSFLVNETLVFSSELIPTVESFLEN